MTGAAIAVPVGAVIQPAKELASGISYVSLSCLGWRELSCARQRALACAVGGRGPDGLAGGDGRGAAHHGRQASGPQARRPFVRPDAGAAAFGRHPMYSAMPSLSHVSSAASIW